MGKTHNYDEFLGYIRVDGPDIESGHIDLQTIKHTIDGTDRVLRHFLGKHSSSLDPQAKINFPIEVRRGCWEIVIPVTAVLTYVVGRPISNYLTEAAKQLAKNDVGNKTTRDVFISAIKSAQNAVRIAKHLGTMKNRQQLDAKVKSADHIEIKNSKGEVIIVTKKALEDYQTTPRDTFSDISYPAVDDRSVHIGYVEAGKAVEQSIAAGARDIFYYPEDEKEELFPELKHGMTVDLEGLVTRGNQRTNTIGFEYKGHILTCLPINNYVSNFLQAHYKKCTMRGMVSRENNGEDGGRPKIHFISLEVIDELGKAPQQQLL